MSKNLIYDPSIKLPRDLTFSGPQMDLCERHFIDENGGGAESGRDTFQSAG